MYPLEVQNQQRMVFMMIHVKGFLPPMGKVWSLDCMGTYCEWIFSSQRRLLKTIPAAGELNYQPGKSWWSRPWQIHHVLNLFNKKKHGE